MNPGKHHQQPHPLRGGCAIIDRSGKHICVLTTGQGDSTSRMDLVRSIGTPIVGDEAK